MTHTESRTKFKLLLKTLSNKGFSHAGIERALSLPQKTLSTYADSERRVPADVISLLEIISTFPWILNVADEGFGEKSAIAHAVHSVFKDIEGTKSALELLASGV